MNQFIKYYQKEYEARRISRREFAGRLGAAGIAATAATSLLTASDSVLADTPVKGGRMRVGWYTHSANDTLNPNRLTTSLDFMRTYQICSPIVRYSTKLTAEPDLATEWNASDDLKTWRFKIRKGIEFHNGKSLTIQDCIYSLNRHRGEQSDSIIKAWLDAIADMKADGDWLVIDLKAPNADFPMYLGDMHAVIVPDGFEDFDNLVGTGPFTLAAGDFRPGVGMLAKKNPNYHHEGYPHVDEVETFGIGDTAARVNALLAGDIHITVRVDPKSIPIIEGAPNTAMANSPSSRHLSFPMVSDRPPTDNRDFRQAMRLLLDRKAVLDNIQKGYGLLGNDTPISSLDPYFCEDIPQRDIDLDKAKFHLKKAEMDGGTIDLRTSESAGGVQSIDIALMMKENAAKIGFNINFIREPADGYWSKVWLNPSFPFTGSNWFPRVTADIRFSSTYISGVEWNEAFWSNERFDELVKMARGVKDGPERREIYCEAQQIMWDEGGSIIPLFTDWLDARSTKLGGHRKHPVGEGDDHRIHEWGYLMS
jgi:peptide/nickel transport system substrate-binding protein